MILDLRSAGDNALMHVCRDCIFCIHRLVIMEWTRNVIERKIGYMSGKNINEGIEHQVVLDSLSDPFLHKSLILVFRVVFSCALACLLTYCCDY